VKTLLKLVAIYILVLFFMVITFQIASGEVKNVTPPPNVVRVRVIEKDNLPAYGTGALLSERIVITNNHVVRGRKSDSSIKIIFPDWTIHTASVRKADAGPDLAAIRLDEVTTVKPLRMGTKPEIGDTLHFWGYGSAIPRKAVGVVTQFLGSRGETRRGRNVAPEEDGDLLEIDTTARNGDSGSPFLNEKGEYVGTLFGSNDSEAMGSHIDTVLDFLGWEKAPTPKPKARLY
jgi:S1-C subfamily serine protease